VHSTVVSAYISLQCFKVISIRVLALSDFSALKNFLRQPAHKNRSKFCFVDSEFVTRNMFSSPTTNFFFYVNPPVTPEQQSGGRQESWRQAFSLSVRSLHSMWWSRLACVLVARDDSILLT